MGINWSLSFPLLVIHVHCDLIYIRVALARNFILFFSGALLALLVAL